MEAGLIVNADDFGVDAATTRGIVSAYQNGIASSASLMVTMPAAAEAAQIARVAGLPVGLHVSLTQGAAVAGPQLHRLVDAAGGFTLRAARLIRVSGRDALLLDQIRTEVRAQLSRAHDLGLTLTHVDSHQHVHMNPAIFAIVESEASAFGIGRIRFSREALGNLFLGRGYMQILRRNNLAKWLIIRAQAARIRPRLETPDLFFGIFNSGVVVKDVLLSFLQKAPARKSVEICIHPGLPDRSAPASNNPLAAFSVSAFRRLEHDALVDQDTIGLVRERGLVLRSFDGRLK